MGSKAKDRQELENSGWEQLLANQGTFLAAATGLRPSPLQVCRSAGVYCGGWLRLCADLGTQSDWLDWGRCTSRDSSHVVVVSSQNLPLAACIKCLHIDDRSALSWDEVEIKPARSVVRPLRPPAGGRGHAVTLT